MLKLCFTRAVPLKLSAGASAWQDERRKKLHVFKLRGSNRVQQRHRGLSNSPQGKCYTVFCLQKIPELYIMDVPDNGI